MNNTYTHIDIQHICTLMYVISPNYIECVGTCLNMRSHSRKWVWKCYKTFENRIKNHIDIDFTSQLKHNGCCISYIVAIFLMGKSCGMWHCAAWG